MSGILLEDRRSIPEMVLTVVEDALDDAALGWDDVDAVVTASVDMFDGLTASSIAVTEVVGAVMKPETRVAADGLVAAIHAAHQISAEAYRTVLVVAHGKASMSPHWNLTSWAMDPILLQPLGVDFLTIAGLQASLLAGSDRDAPLRWAATVAERRSTSAAGTTGPVTAAEVVASPVVASPLRAGTCAPIGDGACAVILGVPGAGGDGTVQIIGAGHDLDAHDPGDRDLTTWSGLGRACRRAYAAAGIEEPEFSVVEPSCLFPHEEDLFMEAAGLGDAAHSPGGGLFAGTAPVVSGLSRLIRVARALEGRPGQRGLAHGTWGPAGQGQAVAVLEAR